VARGDEVSGLLVGSVTDLGHGGLSLESSSDLVVSMCGGKVVSQVWSGLPVMSPYPSML
jgi:hypothetical protein